MNADSRYFRNIERNRLWGGAGLELSWNPGQAVYQVLAAKQELQASRHLLQAERNGVILEAVQAFLDLAEEGARFAEQALEQSTERQKLGTARPFEVFQAQETYIRAMLSYLDVVNAYNKAQYSLYVATGNNL